jgi:phosphatidylglycerol:prolipoprotein diacylglycerol transferase
MDKVALDLGIIQIYWYSIFIFLGILVGSIIIYLESKKREIDLDFVINLIFNTVIVSIIGARLYYVIFNLDYYLSNPIEILEIWNGGLAIHGGILIGLITVIVYCKKHEVEVLKMLDIIVVGLIIAQAIGRWGNFFNQEAYGAVTTVQKLKTTGIPDFIINGMYISGEYREPTFFYESIWNVFGFIALLIIRRYPYLKTGQLSGFYLIWYSSARFIIEGKRADSLMLGNLKMAQLISVIMIIAGIILFIYYKNIKKVSTFEHLYKENPKKEEKEKQLFIKQENVTRV